MAKRSGPQYDTLDKVFLRIHHRAKDALVYPLTMTLQEWLKPILDAAATRAYEEIRPRLNALLELDNSLGLFGHTTELSRHIKLKCEQPEKGCHFMSDSRNEGRQASYPSLRIKVSHHETWGKRHLRAAFGQNFEKGVSSTDPYIANAYDDNLNFLTMPDHVKESWDYTFRQLSTLYTELPHWYAQFSQRMPGNDAINSISGFRPTESYHRIAAAMQYSPIFAQWVQYLRETDKQWDEDKCPPQAKVLRRSSTFKYQKGMSHDLHTVLSSALHLAQAKRLADRGES